ncbi:40S ribosomal protein S19 [Intoshia linei]|uniref:Small ribosomal subunit protein eS19 n=1 Tax=Intoshia linei TaxID=1819745 RepID=A0A177B652_9BILA|nr:40S ribosomal protein S19 [Intoshia linei]
MVSNNTNNVNRTVVTNVRDVDQAKLVVAVAAYLKKSGKVVMPDWVDIVKTGCYKELSPRDPDWFIVRCSSMLRRMYFRNKLMGVGNVKKMYGGRKRRGSKPSHFAKGSGAVARYCLQSLEKLDYVEQEIVTKVIDKDEDDKETKSINRKVMLGRRLTKRGRKLLDLISVQMSSKKKKDITI